MLEDETLTEYIYLSRPPTVSALFCEGEPPHGHVGTVARQLICDSAR
jgi:hypothetical protein